jgi:LacI family transcriptional regulator
MENTLPTIDDVARAAGVSTATVSRALNRPESVSQSLRNKVDVAVKSLRYVPHAGARALMLRRSGTVGAVFPTLGNAIFATAIDALQRRLAQSDIQLLIATSGYDVANEMRQAINLVTRGADALIVCGLRQHADLQHFVRQRDLPCVHVMVYEPGGEHLSVGFDNITATAQVTQYLLDLGHRRIAMLAGITLQNDRASQRVDGVRLTLAKAGLDFPKQYLVEQPYTLAAAREGLHQLMAKPLAPTAIICGNDILAFGALLEAASMGLQVPRQLSIVGFDDLEIARHLQPALTTVQVPTEAMWSTAAERVIAAIQGEAVTRSTKIDVALVVRQSTGPAPHDH